MIWEGWDGFIASLLHWTRKKKWWTNSLTNKVTISLLDLLIAITKSAMQSLAENHFTDAPNKDNLCTMKTTSTRKAEYLENLKLI